MSYTSLPLLTLTSFTSVIPARYQHDFSLSTSSMMQPNEYTSTFDVTLSLFSSSGAMLVVTTQ